MGCPLLAQSGHGLVQCKCLRLTQSGHRPNSFTDELMSSRFNRFWLPVLRLSKMRSETRTRLIKVVPKNEKEVGVPHWNGTRPRILKLDQDPIGCGGLLLFRVASWRRIWPIAKTRSEDRVNDPRLPVRSGP